MLEPAQAHEMGIADALFEPADFLERSLEWAAVVVRGETTVTAADGRPSDIVGRRRSTSPGPRWTSGCTAPPPAPYRALDLLALAKDAPFADGTAAEDEALADLVLSEELRSGLYAFDLVQRRAKRPAGAPGQGAGPPGHQGRHRRRRPDGEPAGAAVRPAARGAGGADRPRPGPGRQGTSYVHGEIDKLAAKGRLDAGQGGQAARPGHRQRRQGAPSPTPTS